MGKPSWHGFNLLWMYFITWRNVKAEPSMVKINEKDVDFIANMGVTL